MTYTAKWTCLLFLLLPPEFSEGAAVLRTSQGVCSEGCGVEVGGQLGSLEKRLEGPQAGNLLPKLQFHPPKPCSPQTPLQCSHHGALRHSWGALAMEHSDTLGVLLPCSSQTPSEYYANQAPPRLSALGHQVYAETAAFTPTLPVFLLLHGASLLSWPCVLEPSLSHCLLGSIHTPPPISHSSPIFSFAIFLPSLYNHASHGIFDCSLSPYHRGWPCSLSPCHIGLTVLPISVSQGLTVLPISVSHRVDCAPHFPVTEVDHALHLRVTGVGCAPHLCATQGRLCSPFPCHRGWLCSLSLSLLTTVCLCFLVAPSL